MSRQAELSIASLLGNVLQPDNSNIVIAEWTAEFTGGERVEIAPPHIHHEDDEIWYVLEGELGFAFDGEEFVVPAGGAACARRGVTHTYWNASQSDTRYLLVMSRRINDLIACLHDPDKRGNRSFDKVFRDHASELVATG